MVIIVIVIVIVIMVVCCTCEPTVSRANKPCLIIILPPSSLSGNIAWSTILIQHHFQQYYHQQCLDYPQDSWYPVSLEFLTDLWIPNVFIYNLKSFQSIAVLKRLAGESKWLFFSISVEFSILNHFHCLNFSLRQNLKDPLTIMVSLIKQDRLKFLAWIFYFKWHLQPKWPIRRWQRWCRSLQHCFQF